MTRAGNDRAFEAIVARYKGDLLRYCSRILPDGRSDDAVQQVFVNAYKALHRDTTPLSLRSWLYGIAHNVSLNVLRQRGHDHEPLESHPGFQEPAHVTSERRERLREVLAAVAALPPGQRDALLLRELEGRGHEEIARELGVTGNAARQLINRARNGVRSAAAAILPMPLLMRLTEGTAPSPTAERLTELTAASGGLTVAKVVATAAVGGALLGGAVETQNVVRDRDHGDVAEAAPMPAKAASDPAASHEGSDDTSARAESDSGRAEDRAAEAGGDDGLRQASIDDSNSGPGDGGDDGATDDDGSNSGPGGGGDDGLSEDNSGPGSGSDDLTRTDNSGPGSGGDTTTTETDNSGPGSGGDTTTTQTDNSGPGSGSDDTSSLDSSGPGSGSDDTVPLSGGTEGPH